MNLNRIISCTFFLLCVFFVGSEAYGQAYEIIPKPQTQEWGDGVLVLNRNIDIQYKGKNDTISRSIKLFQEQLQQLGIPTTVNKKGKGSIAIRITDGATQNKPLEGYNLTVTTDGIQIAANDHAGVFYGLQSLRQLLPPVRNNDGISLRTVVIEDAPAIHWRGMMLDVSRHFYTKESILHILDLLAQYKMNVFHWHLCDNEGWRIEIKQYPKLTEVAAWRNEVVGSRMYSKDSSSIDLNDTYRYGGYYTQEEIREVVNYAAQRNIMVLPEIELPGHSGAVLAAYPELSCRGNVQPVPNKTIVGGLVDQQLVNMEFCAGKEESFVFLENVLAEVMTLFPSPYIHIGGDEVDKTHWKNCALCQERKTEMKLKDEDELQSYFVKRIERSLSKHGKKLIGWDEILEGGLPESSIVMSWRGEKGGIKAAQLGHEVIMSPSDPLYLNRYQDNPETEPWAARFSINTLDRVYDYWPYKNLGGAQYNKFIKGVQFAIWTEFVPSIEHLEYMLLPRMPALAEAIWSGPDQKNYTDFVKRLHKGHFQGWQQKGIRFNSKNFRQ